MPTFAIHYNAVKTEILYSWCVTTVRKMPMCERASQPGRGRLFRRADVLEGTCLEGRGHLFGRGAFVRTPVIICWQPVQLYQCHSKMVRWQQTENNSSHCILNVPWWCDCSPNRSARASTKTQSILKLSEKKTTKKNDKNKKVSKVCEVNSEVRSRRHTLSISPTVQKENSPAIDVLLVHDTSFDNICRSSKYCCCEARTCAEIHKITLCVQDKKNIEIQMPTAIKLWY